MFNDDLLTSFMHTFYGYGTYHAPYWFIGMEEGGGDSFQEVQDRLTVWEQRSKNELEDLAEYHLALGIKHHFEGAAPLQRTWSKLIRIVLTSKGQIATPGILRVYQRDYLGRKNQETCLLELLPLPSPSTAKWLYKDFSQLPALLSREVYRNALAPMRVAHLRQRIAQHQPKAVIFYGMDYLAWWQQIAGMPFQENKVGSHRLLTATHSQTKFFVTAHPVATGITNAYFEAVGKLI